MPKRTTYEIRDNIVMIIKDGEYFLSKLEKKVKTNFLTVKRICSDLELLGLVKINRIEKHPSNGKESYNISITEQGRKYSVKLNSKK
jgi:predicted transcriptional regulator